MGRERLDEDRLNIEIRKYLKKVGITAQREIENAVRQAIDNGTLAANASVAAKTTLELPELGLVHVVEQTLQLG